MINLHHLWLYKSVDASYIFAIQHSIQELCYYMEVGSDDLVIVRELILQLLLQFVCVWLLQAPAFEIESSRIFLTVLLFLVDLQFFACQRFFRSH